MGLCRLSIWLICEETIQCPNHSPDLFLTISTPPHLIMCKVPCLGKDLIREFFYDKVNGKIEHELNTLPSGLCTGMADGPRYLEFHPKYNTMYCVNELSSTIAVFSVNKDLIRAINIATSNGESLERFRGQSTLTLIQSINTIPNAFPKKLNTCGRLCLHKSGRFVLVSNRGHQSIAILRVKEHGPSKGHLATVGYFHTRGETPRHFKVCFQVTNSLHMRKQASYRLLYSLCFFILHSSSTTRAST